jgi:hypothetical protein
MPRYDSQHLLSLLRTELRRPEPQTLDDLLTEDMGYEFLTQAQEAILEKIAQHRPELNYAGPPVKLVTDDQGYSYRFGGTAEEPLEVIGAIELYASPTRGQLLAVGPFYGEQDAVMDGTHVRFPGGRPRLFTDGPYARFVPRGQVIDATHQPVLRPVAARILIVYRAASLFATGPGRLDPAPFDLKETRRWAELLLTIQTMQAAEVDGTTSRGQWWTNLVMEGGESYRRYEG